MYGFMVVARNAIPAPSYIRGGVGRRGTVGARLAPHAQLRTVVIISTYHSPR